MLLTAAGFRKMTQMVLDTRPDHRGIVAVLEGGYDRTHLPTSVLATLEPLTGQSASIEEAVPAGSEIAYSAVRGRVRQVRSIVRNYWNI
jgi:acetoin utilization deacetylase AcuC-like enzyme